MPTSVRGSSGLISKGDGDQEGLVCGIQRRHGQGGRGMHLFLCFSTREEVEGWGSSVWNRKEKGLWEGYLVF